MLATAPSIDISVFDLTDNVPGHTLRIKRTMIDMSHALEEAAATTRGCFVFASFQRFSLFAAEADRYRRMSASWDHAWIYGVPDVDVPNIPNITAVPITPDHELAREWFVIADGPSFGCALLTADVSGFAIADRRRHFMGVWTTDAAIVREASSRLLEAIDLPAPTWTIDPVATLGTFTQMSSQLLALSEERLLSKAAEKPVSGKAPAG